VGDASASFHNCEVENGLNESPFVTNVPGGGIQGNTSTLEVGNLNWNAIVPSIDNVVLGIPRLIVSAWLLVSRRDANHKGGHDTSLRGIRR
jgi:hypothetical protein